MSIKAIKKILHQGKKVLIYINKKGVHTGIVCSSCGYIPYCNNCDIPIGVYQNNHKHLFGLCPICQTTYSTFSHCPQCHKTMSGYGVGIQMIADECEHLFGYSPVIVSASTSGSLHKAQALLSDISDNPLIVSTSLLQVPRIDTLGLIVLQNANTPAIPDINTQVYHFQFLQQLFTYSSAPHILLQTSAPDNYVLQCALGETPDIFYQKDYAMRTKHHYPPHGEMCIVTYRHEMESALYTKVNTLFHDLLMVRTKKYEGLSIEIFAIPATIYKMYNKFRYQIIIKGPEIRSFMDEVFVGLFLYQRGFKCDRGATGFM